MTVCWSDDMLRTAVIASLALVFMLSLAAVPALRAQSEEPLSLGRKITAELHSIIEEHKEALRLAMVEYKAAKKSLHEERLQLIKDFINESKRLRDEVKAEIESLRNLFKSGNITSEEYVSRLRVLKARLEALGKSSEKLGKILSSLADKSREAVKNMVEELRKANEEFGRQVSEEARTIGESAREAVGRGVNATNTHPLGKGRGGDEKDKPRGEDRGNITETQTHGESQTAHRNRNENHPQDGGVVTTTTTTVAEGHPGNGRGRGRGG